MDFVYGIQVTGSNDQYITMAEKVGQMLAAAALPAAFLVGLIPLRAYLKVRAILRVLISMFSEIRAQMVFRS